MLQGLDSFAPPTPPRYFTPAKAKAKFFRPEEAVSSTVGVVAAGLVTAELRAENNRIKESSVDAAEKFDQEWIEALQVSCHHPPSTSSTLQPQGNALLHLLSPECFPPWCPGR